MLSISNFLKKNESVNSTDFLMFIYLVFLSVIVFVFQSNLENWYSLVATNLVAIILVYFFIKNTQNIQNPIIKFLRKFYPFIIIFVIFKETQALSHILWQDFFDYRIIDLELKFFGIYPNVFLEKFTSSHLTEFLSFSIIAFRLIIFISLLYFYFANRCKAFNELLLSLIITLLFSFTLMFLVPTQGPLTALTNQFSINLDGYFFTNLLNRAMQNIYLLSFPSVFVACAITAWTIISRYIKSLAYSTFPLLLIFIFAVIYLRYNYITDVLAGILVSWISLYIYDVYEQSFLKKKITNI